MSTDTPPPTPHNTDNPPPPAQAQTTIDAHQLLQTELDATKAKYMTALADIENMRKRHSREREEYSRYASAGILMTILPFLDNFQLALDAARTHHPEAKNILDGFGMLIPQMMQGLTAQGLQAISPKAGDTFDPNSHESVGEAPSADIPHHAILACQRPGYRLHDRLLRPAAVVLSSGATK